jgi:protein phosphatase
MDLLTRLFARAHALFQAEPILLAVTSPCIIVGDIHGQLPDLALILLTFGGPLTRSDVFLGDLVDRCEFSLECVTVVFLMKVLSPETVFLIRGNHEFQTVCSDGGLFVEVLEEFGISALYQSPLRAFAELPLAAVIDGTTLCIHGGLSPNFQSVQQICRIERPIREFSDEVIEGLLWSDPSPDITGFARSAVRRIGFLYGEDVALNFLRKNKLTRIVRSHE